MSEINDLLEAIVSKQLKEILATQYEEYSKPYDIVKETAKEIISPAVHKIFDGVVQNEIKAFIQGYAKELIDGELGKPLTIGDSWSGSKTYATLQEFVFEKIKNALKDDYSIKNYVAKIVKEEVDKNVKIIIDLYFADLKTRLGEGGAK